MFEINRQFARTCSMLGQRGAIFGLASPILAEEDPKFILLTADLATLSGMDRYISQYPEQFLNIGIAEQNMLGVASGLKAEGYNPVATTYATFITMRACEQIRHFMGYMKLGFTIVGSGAGLSQGFAGNTHYTIEDISMMRVIPNLNVISPSDAASAVKLYQVAVNSSLPVYIRLTGGLNCPIVYTQDVEFKIGGSHKLMEGEEIAILACGTMVKTAMESALLLNANGISSNVYDMYSVKPLDRETVINNLDKKLIVTIEEHSKSGGLGASVAEIMTEYNNSPKLLRLGIEDTFNLAGDPNHLLEINRLTRDFLCEDILNALKA